ncbi:UNVERIFIED_CONTAM: cell surface protein, partial [Bifidobacterium animalis]|nr:cell surface protein [Bifidobacterium animalis]
MFSEIFILILALMKVLKSTCRFHYKENIMKNKKLVAIAATLLIRASPVGALINQPIHPVQAVNQTLKDKIKLKKTFNNTIQVF